MASELPVMMAMRALWPTVRHRFDKIAVAVHAFFVAKGYVLTATGPEALSETAFSNTSTGTHFSPRRSLLIYFFAEFFIAMCLCRKGDSRSLERTGGWVRVCLREPFQEWEEGVGQVPRDQRFFLLSMLCLRGPRSLLISRLSKLFFICGLKFIFGCDFKLWFFFFIVFNLTAFQLLS